MKKKILFSLIILLTLFFSQKSWAEQSPEEISISASQAAQNGNYQQAITDYQRLLSLEGENGYLYYNLGNIYFKQNDYYRAYAYYRKAQKFIPREKKLQQNLQIVMNLFTKEDLSLAGENAFFTFLTFNEVIICFLFFWYLSWFLIIFNHFLAKKTFFNLSFTSIFIAIFLLGIISFKYNQKQIQGIIVEKETSVKSDTDLSAIKLFNIEAGTIFTIREIKGNWLKIEIIGEKKGWIPLSAAEII